MEKKPIPIFKTEEEEEEFWSNNDSTDYIDWDNAKHVRFSNLKPSTKTISLRLPQILLEDIKIMANKRDVPYQSMIKMMLADLIEKHKHC
jgi:predicted DNA binding CopG/RHH family protein